MKSIARINILIAVFFILSLHAMNGQTAADSSAKNKEYKSLEEALRNPTKVYRLDLSNQNFKMLSDTIWDKFENLEYLSLKNDHLKELPAGIGNLKNLRTLDLSGNDFKVLPTSFSRLKNLNEIYLNDEKEMDFNKSLVVIKGLPNLKVVHLENDDLKVIPESLLYLTQLETLYLNNNLFNKIPMELKELKKLKFIDLHDNKFKPNDPSLQNNGIGVKIRF